jgi:hypothetical protein
MQCSTYLFRCARWSTFSDLQALAKQYYRRLNKRYHPDRMRSATHPHPMQGYRFQRITATYRWLLTFPPDTHLPQARTPIVLTWRYETPPIAEMALPFALERQPLVRPPRRKRA